MNTYVIISDTNYDEVAQVVNADSKEEALKVAEENGAWKFATVTEIDTEKRGITFDSFCGGELG